MWYFHTSHSFYELLQNTPLGPNMFVNIFYICCLNLIINLVNGAVILILFNPPIKTWKRRDEWNNKLISGTYIGFKFSFFNSCYKILTFLNSQYLMLAWWYFLTIITPICFYNIYSMCMWVIILVKEYKFSARLVKL